MMPSGVRGTAGPRGVRRRARGPRVSPGDRRGRGANRTHGTQPRGGPGHLAPPDPTRTRDGVRGATAHCAGTTDHTAHKPETRFLSTHARRPIKARSRIPLTSDLSAASPCSVTDGVDLRRYGNLTGNLNPGYASSDQDKGQATDSAMVVFIGERSHAPAPNFANAFAAACSAQPLQRTVYG